MKNYKNVLFISVDDLRPELGCYGKKKLHTPTMDKLANQGIQFNRAYCQVPQCMPSRSSLMSGVRPDKNTHHLTYDICVNGEPTLPGVFKSNGYRTVSIGKIYHYNHDDAESWVVRNTETFYERDYACDGYCSGYQTADNQTAVKNYGKQFKGWSPDTLTLPSICECVEAPDEAYPDGLIAHRACEELISLSDSGEPFFLAVGFYRPHLPWAVPKKYWDLYDKNDVDLADNQFLPKDAVGVTDLCDFRHYGDKEIRKTYSDLGHYDEESFPVLNEDKQRECVHGYWASVSFADAQIGKVIDALEADDLADDTLIVLWGDNGWHLGEHRLWSKVTSFEESTRVPVLFAAKDMPAGVQSDALAELLDVYPTICEMTGMEQPKHLDGTSLVPIWSGEKDEVKDAVFSRIGHNETVRTHAFRLTRYRNHNPQGDFGHLANDIACELFDLTVDPQENENVARKPEYSAVVESMKARLDDQKSSFRAS